MNEIKIYLKPSGSTAELYKDFNLYQESYRNVQISIYVPTSILYKDVNNTFLNTVQTGAIITAPNGTKVVTKSFNSNFVKTIMQNNIEYAKYTQIMPKEYALYAGTQIIVCNVVNIDNTDEVSPKIISVVTTQRVPLVVMESAFLSEDKILEPNEAEVIDGLINGLQQQLNEGTFAARAIYPYNSDYEYGVNELVFYPNKGEYGVFLKSLVIENDNPPYTGDGLNSEYWEEITDFNILNELYGLKTDVKQLVLTATEQAAAAADSAALASASEQNAANSATEAESAKQVAEASATEAHSWADVAKGWAEYGIKINTEYTALDELPDPGDSRYIYLIPNGSTGENSYDEYIWADSKNAYEKIGTTEIDLTAYATKVAFEEEIASRQEADTLLSIAVEKKLDKLGGEIAGDLSVKGFLTAPKLNTEQLIGRSGEAIIDQNPRMFAIDFGNIHNEMRLHGKGERPVYFSANSLSEEPNAQDIALLSDVNTYLECYSVSANKLIFTENGDFELVVGKRITVKFIYANTANSPTLKIDDTDAIEIKADGDATYVKWRAGSIMDFVYDGDYWVCVAGYALAGMRVGSLYFSNNSTSPATLYGGSWTAIHDRFIVGAGNSYSVGTTGGEATHTLTVNELPAHRHELLGSAGESNTWSSNAIAIGFKSGARVDKYVAAVETSNGSTQMWSTNKDGTYYMSATGSGQSHNNMPPYYAAYIWYRTA